MLRSEIERRVRMLLKIDMPSHEGTVRSLRTLDITTF